MSKLTDSDRDEIFFKYIYPNLILGLKIVNKPQAYILGGQPGAGKSHFIKLLLNENENLAVINGDDFRGYHPKYRYFLEQNEKQASDLVQSDINYWIEKALFELAKQGYSLIIEGTIRNVTVPIKTAKLLKRYNYNVNVEVILTKPELSQIDILKRYLLQKQQIGLARFTKISAHKIVIENIFENILQLASVAEIDNLRLYRRVLTNYVLLYNKQTDYRKECLAEILEQEKNRALSKQELKYISPTRNLKG